VEFHCGLASPENYIREINRLGVAVSRLEKLNVQQIAVERQER
jgi:hypothetical protein